MRCPHFLTIKQDNQSAISSTGSQNEMHYGDSIENANENHQLQRHWKYSEEIFSPHFSVTNEWSRTRQTSTLLHQMVRINHLCCEGESELKSTSHILPWCLSQATSRYYFFSFWSHHSKEPKIRMTQLKRRVGIECAPKHYERQYSPFFSEINIGRKSSFCSPHSLEPSFLITRWTPFLESA